MWKFSRTVILALAVLSVVSLSHAQDRRTKVLDDREQFRQQKFWIYNDFEKALKEARDANKPLFVVLRCIPCEACSEFDKELMDRQEELKDLLNQFVCVRVIQGNGLDLSLFQFDYDQSYHALFLNADKTIYGRFGTRSQREEDEDLSIEGLREALAGALELHRGYPANRAQLVGKSGPPAEIKVPEELPRLKGKYTAKLDYEGKVVQSCIHCHMIRDSQRVYYREAGKPMPADLLYPFPLPDVLGLRMDPAHRATITQVEPGSTAAKAKLQAGDRINTLNGQPILSTADLQWVLHRSGETAEIAYQGMRGDKPIQGTINLTKGWREKSNISWRPTSWDLRRIAIGGMKLDDMPDTERNNQKIPADKMALKVAHVGQYGEHATAMRAGVQKGDILVGLDGKSERISETEFIARTIAKPAGSLVKLQVRRGEKTLDVQFAVQ